MNIIMVSIDFPPIPGGISAHVYELSKALTKLGHKVTIITRRNTRDEKPVYFKDTIRIYKIKLKIAGIFYGIQINNFIKKKLSLLKPDIIHIHGLRPLEWHNIKNPPLSYTNHTSGYLKKIEKNNSIKIALLKRLFKKPKLFIAPSKELLNVPFDIDAKKFFITNGVDSIKYGFDQTARNKLRKKLKIEDNIKLGILTRRLEEKNGVIYLAKAAKHIKNPDIKFLIIGDGKEKKKIKNAFNQSFPNRFIMLGEKEHDEIAPYYSAADFSILPSLMEATSISGLEAMSSFLPIVGTDTGGIPDIIKDGYNGYLCKKADEYDLAEKIDLLLSQNYKELGKNSRKLIKEKFTWEQIAKKTVKAYETII
ncbi:MAG: glycosyltransferase family 4 protein [Deltaproteobacteria bacterium]|nr:glycosyltransferase family 4 protein [Deltaproteobacteria bacterium]